MSEKINEDTPASVSLAPQNKSQMLGAALSALAGLGIEDLSHFLTDALASVQNLGAAIPDNAVAVNQGSLAPAAAAMKEAVKQDITNILSEGEDLSEEMKQKATDLFEAALEARLVIEKEIITEEAALALEAAFDELKEEMVEAIDVKLDLVIETWLKDNAVAVESSLRNQIAEDFIASMRNVFLENSITVPEKDVNLVESLSAKTTALEEKYNAAIETITNLKSQINEDAKKNTLNAMCEGLALTQADRLKTLCESVEFTGDVDSYKTKLTHIKEQFLNKKPVTTGILTEESDPNSQDTAGKPVVVEPQISRYISAISQTVRNS